MNKMWVWFGFPAGIGVLLLFMVVMSGESARADALKVVDVKVGDGRAAKKGDAVKVQYLGTVNGKVFDKTEQPVTLVLGEQQGWEKGIEGMKEGGVREITISSELAFGPKEKSRLPPKTELHFKVMLMEVE